jgi:magnesium-transporting ATPase (P-type)
MDTSVTATVPVGLSDVEVAERRVAGLVNEVPERTSRSYAGIVRSNVLTRFNAIITVLAGTILIVGHPVDALFALVMVFNTVIGIVQEVRAKRTLDRLAVLVAPTVIVVRNGEERAVEPSALVLDDVVRLRPGDQVPFDAAILASDGLEVDESALTGEADPVAKHDGDEVRSGSAVIAGSAIVRATRVGRDAWIHQLVEQAKAFALTRSELRVGVDRLLRLVGWILGPLSALLLWSQLRGDAGVPDGLVSAVAGVVGLVPQGLVLLVSMAMAVAIVRLARNHVLVQELHAVEGLARVDVLCVDKTGTLTTGHFVLDDVVAVGVDHDALAAGLGALLAAEANPTSSTKVLAESFAAPAGWHATAHVPFSSARKWSGTTFAGDRGTWVIGAPEILLDSVEPSSIADIRARVDAWAAEAKRVLLVASGPRPLDAATGLPDGLRAVGIVALAEQLRADAARILGYFARQHVAVKIISGDSAATVSAVARRLGVDGAERAVDLRHLEPGTLECLAPDATVFGRVLPEQKRELVEALQRAGHTVAMTGDGVNDIPALKRADIGIAVDTATPATKAVAQLILLDGRFDRLPHVVGEGRRVIANMERVSALFITKTVYATLFALAIGVSGAAFPFLPRHMSLVSELTIGVPAFLLSFRAADEPCRPGYLRRVLRFAAPAGVVAASVTLATYWVARSPLLDASLDEARTLSTFVLTSTALWVLYRLMQPIDRLDRLLLVALVAVFAVVVTIEPTQDFYALDWPAPLGIVTVVAIAAGSVVALEIALVTLRPQDWRWLQRLAGDAG